MKFLNTGKNIYLKWGMGLIILLLLNVLTHRFLSFRIDLTEEKRFALTNATKNLLRGVDDMVVINVYLEGEFPPGFRRLQRAIKETLDEFKVYAGKHIHYQFIDPDKVSDRKERNVRYQTLAQQGIQPTNLFITESGKKVEKLIFPGAIMAYQGKEIGVLLLKGNKGQSPQAILNQSIEGIEYELASAIRKLTSKDRKKIALIKGHGKPDSLSIAGLVNTLLEFYDVFKVDLPKRQSLIGYDALIIAQLSTAFSEQDKYKIDQFIVNGGKALFFLDAMQVNRDSIADGAAFAFPYQLNLDDLLFRYGIRLNKDLIQDLNSAAYPVVVGRTGNQPQIQLLPWPFFPLINRFSKHPIVRNLDAIYTQFVSTVDTVRAEGIRKTPLLFTSPYTRVSPAPVSVDLNSLRNEMKPSYYSQGSLPIAYLLEGRFISLYKNRILPKGVEPSLFKEKGMASKIIFCSDGDIINNHINPQSGDPLPLGFDPFTQTTFANQDFVMNALSYLLDEKGLIIARNKEVKIRPLDKIKIETQRTFWQTINLGLPLVLLIAFGMIRAYLRKRKYGKNR